MNLTATDLAKIVEKASFLSERLNPEHFVIDVAHSNEEEIKHRLARWCQVIAQGNWKKFQERLQYDELNINTVRSLLGSVQLAKKQPFPDWVETLQQVMQTAVGFTCANQFFLPTDPAKPLPFEDILLPVIILARQKLLSRLESPQLSSEYLPLSILSEAAYCSLERSLMEQLTDICAKTLYFEFSQVRPLGYSLVNLLLQETETSNNRTYYNNFVNQLLQDGLLAFFQKYPVLGRLISIRLNFWVEFIAEFLLRLADDREVIQQVFGSKSTAEPQEVDQGLTSLGKVSEIETSLSDSHNRGRAVIALSFESGLKLVYKPKNLGLEVAFTQFLAWCNRHNQTLAFKVMQILNRQSYGWMEYIEHRPCTDEAAAQRFYQRAGMLLCLLYVLKGTDCHRENLIACGEHLVLVDMETILHHEANLMKDSLLVQEFETIAEQQFWGSVLCTGLLPRWDFSPDMRIASDISGLGSIDPQQALGKTARWQCINTDNMHLRDETVTLPLQKNVPLLDEVVLFPNDYQAYIIAGFEQMYRFLLAQRQVLLSLESPLFTLQHQRVRFVFRATRVYKTVLQNTLMPHFLKDGIDLSIELDLLSRAFLVAQSKPDAWPILGAELMAMEQLDIPYFSASTASDTLSLETNQEISQYFKQPSYQQLLTQLQTLDETDLARQIAIIQGVFMLGWHELQLPRDGNGKPSLDPCLLQNNLFKRLKHLQLRLKPEQFKNRMGVSTGSAWAMSPMRNGSNCKC